MQREILAPLYARKNDVNFKAYSLKGWDFKDSVSRIRTSSPLSKAINRISPAALTCISAPSFFKYCLAPKDAISRYLSETLPKKTWLSAISAESVAKKGAAGKTVREFFDNQRSIFDCIGEKDLNAAYSQMQYVEGFALARDAVQRGLDAGKKRIKVVFALPNDEGKYYLDYPKELEKMLRMEFGDALRGVEIDLSFRFFQYEYSEKDPGRRPYNAASTDPKVSRKLIGSYWSFLTDSRIGLPRTGAKEEFKGSTPAPRYDEATAKAAAKARRALDKADAIAASIAASRAAAQARRMGAVKATKATKSSSSSSDALTD